MNAHEQLDHELTKAALRRTTRLLMRWSTLNDHNTPDNPERCWLLTDTRHALEHTPRINQQVVEIHADNDKARASQ